MTEGEREAVGRLPLFLGLPGAQVARLLEGAAVRRCVPGAMLFQEGEAARHLHVLVAGIAELTKMEGRKEYGVLMLSAGDVFMPAAALFDEPYLASARILTAARILSLEIPAVRRELAGCAALTARLARIMGGQWRMAVRHILDLKCRSAAQRLAAFLLRLVDESPLDDDVELPIPKRHLASRVGMTAETLSRALQTIADNGLHVRGTRILVRDRAKIESFCGPDPYPDPAEELLYVHAL
ncbi:MAG TPA: helix-turn-helix domain-containing protein [Allosphingosinicella sp.]|nr:helix-turn-helix domain-containing protein [Allosphingosinicella sp.]